MAAHLNVGKKLEQKVRKFHLHGVLIAARNSVSGGRPAGQRPGTGG
jgi:hypothetical protein